MPSLVEAVLVCQNVIFREGLTHLLAGTRFRVRQANLSLDGLEDISPNDQIVFILSASSVEPGLPWLVGNILSRYTRAKIVVLATTTDVDAMIQAIEIGVSGYMAESVSADALIKSLEVIMADGVVFPAASLLRLRAPSPKPPAPIRPAAEETGVAEVGGARAPGLSIREVGILQALVLGDSNKAIARKLQIAEATVKVHVKSILRKIHVRNRTQAAIWAMYNGVSAPQDAGPVMLHGFAQPAAPALMSLNG